MEDGHGRFVDEGTVGRMFVLGFLLAAGLFRLAFGCVSDSPRHLDGVGMDIFSDVDSLAGAIVSVGSLMRGASSAVQDKVVVVQSTVDSVSHMSFTDVNK